MLHVDGLRVTYSSPTGPVAAVRGVSLELAAGDCLGIVGESGCGKSSLARALLGLLPPGAGCRGSVTLHGQELVGLPEAALRKLRGARMALVPQAAMSALDPVLRIGRQLTEPLAVHRSRTSDEARRPGSRRTETRRTAEELLSMVGLPPQLARAYPHELSGGMRQRAVIAAALAAGPDLLIADEPTTGLDVLAQAEVLGLLRRLRLELGLGLLLISHDLRVVLAHADRVLVMYAGAEVETGPPAQLATRPKHPYTAGLLDALPPLYRDARGWTSIPGTPPDPRRPVRGCAFAPRCQHVLALCRTQEPMPRPTATGRLSCHLDKLPTRAAPQRRQTHPRDGTADRSPPVLEIRGLTVDYRRAPDRRGTLPTRAVDDVDLVVPPRAIVGLVGASGSGKTTVARAVLRLVTPTAGSIRVSGTDIAQLGARRLRSHRRRVALVPQDSFASLHPAMRVADLVAEPLMIAGRRRGAADRVRDVLATVGLNPTPDLLASYPGRLSGGQRQRVALARALAGEPDLLIADEPTSMLDASVRAGVAATLSSLTTTPGLAILIITHDLTEAAQLCDQLYVLSAGRIVETGPTERVLSSPDHPETRALLDAAGQQGRTRTHLPP